MTGLNRAAVVSAVLVAGVLTVARTGEGGNSGMVRVSRSVAHGAERTVRRISDAFARFFEDEEVRVRADVDVRVRTSQGSGQQAGSDFTWSGVVATGESIEVKGVNGSVIAELAAGNEIEVRAEKTSRRSDPDDVRIEVIEHSDGVTVCAVYPSSRGRQNTCEAGSGGRSNVRNNDVRVTFPSLPTYMRHGAPKELE